MHHALEIHEILLNIFGHCYPPDTWQGASNLASLARTCLIFKEPALDILWEELDDLSILARCLPEASHRTFADRCYYSFDRSLTQREWDILRDYTRRIRSIFIEDVGTLDQESLNRLSKPPTTESLFPNLCDLRFQYTHKTTSLLLLPLTSITSPHVELSLELLAKISPSLRTLFIDLQVVVCHRICLSVITLAHLSRTPALTQLDFRLRDTLPEQTSPTDPPLVFSNLHTSTIFSPSLGLVSRLLSRTRLPAITKLTVGMGHCPSNQDLSSFLAIIQTSGVGQTIQDLRLIQDYSSSRKVPLKDRPLFGLEDLAPCMAFSHIRTIKFDVEYQVHMTDSQLLTLVSAWPRLEQININQSRGWNTRGGVTPNGLLQLLRTKHSLYRVTLAIDTRGYTETNIPPSHGRILPRAFRLIGVVDSFIEAESVPAMAAFFAGVVSPCEYLCHAWGKRALKDSTNADVYKDRWEDVYKRVRDAVAARQRS
ncbi:hypothetical protein EV363DRAFT_1429498 [Boletus edulis]|nr:hypothetical protein EV363DRAFT_1429498 [Boletus edulis]